MGNSVATTQGMEEEALGGKRIGYRSRPENGESTF
jgi:hypothetical protein